MGKHDAIKTKKDIKKKKRKRFKSRFFIIILIILAIAGGLFAKRVYDLDGNWLAALLGHNKHTLERLEKLYILVMGESTGMSDTIIVCSYDPKTQEASMLSIPRDTYIENGDSYVSAYNKINSLYNNGKNPEKTMKAVNEITGLDIKHYILIDTEGLVKLVDRIGGLEFYVPMDMKYDDYSQDLHVDLKEGWQKLDGNKVEQLVRFRHNADGSTYSYEYGMEDFGRMRTQREVIMAIAKQTLKVKNIKEIGHIIDITEKYVQTNMKFGDLKDYLPYAVNMNTENIKAEQLPGQAKYIDGISFFVHDKEETKDVVNELFFGIQRSKTEE